MPKSLSKQSKEFVVSLISFFERERDEGGPFIPLEAVREVCYDYDLITKHCIPNFAYRELQRH